MSLNGVRVGLGVTGSHCTLAEVMAEVEKLVRRGADVYPVASPSVASTDTRFGTALGWLNTLEQVTGRTPWRTIAEVEPIGPRRLLDVMVVAPCTGNTMGKLANAITDTAVTMAAKAHLRNGGPLVLAISTNDGLGLGARNLGTLLAADNVFFVPFGQDDTGCKPNSLSAHWHLLGDTIVEARGRRQLQPVLVEFGR